ncbi:hypothetical protein MRX96_006968 [Rhipicephalus microplus]
MGPPPHQQQHPAQQPPPNERAPATYGGGHLQPWDHPPGLPPLTSMHAPSSTGVMPPPPQQPCLDLSGEIWVETKNPQGKAYYYNARTRESAWNKPEGPGIKVLSQEQIESMAAAAGVAPGGGLVTNAVPVSTLPMGAAAVTSTISTMTPTPVATSGSAVTAPQSSMVAENLTEKARTMTTQGGAAVTSSSMSLLHPHAESLYPGGSAGCH